MLSLKNINKDYFVNNETTVHALKNISLDFRHSEFVSVLGPSGCGKTTLLNMIGGLDRYTDGDLIIDGKSTKDFRSSDWDIYRNRKVGFVFQSYNLIPHLSVLENVTIALNFAGVGKAERRRRAKMALEHVGLGGQFSKRPNQLSGGQMQRVAIARALVGDPEIILADEPTGALDTETGVQVMDLLKEIANDRLVILVTHNEQLAEQYSTRIIRLMDGVVTDDSNPPSEAELLAEAPETDTEQTLTPDSSAKNKFRRFWTTRAATFGISLRNLRGKLGRTILTVFAGSIGIFGIALVLAISGGMDNYVEDSQREAVEGNAITVGESAYNVSHVLDVMNEENGGENPEYPDIDGVLPWKRDTYTVTTALSEDFIEYVKNIDPSWIQTVDYSYSLNLHVLRKDAAGVYKTVAWSNYARQAVNKAELIEDNYEVLAHSEGESGYPQNKTDIVLVVDKFNRINPDLLTAIGVDVGKDEEGHYKKVLFSDIVDKELEIVFNDGWYKKSGNTYRAISALEYPMIAKENKLTVKIVGVLRTKNNDATPWLNTGLTYLPELSEFLVQNAADSEVGKAQIESQTINVLTGKEFSPLEYGTEKEQQEHLYSQYIAALKSLGAYQIPISIHIYPKDIDSRQKIVSYIDEWNNENPGREVSYLDLTELVLSILSTLIDTVIWMLILFSAVALVVSTIMISTLTYSSVVERTKEIGILRSIGASKGNVSGVFNSETTMIGAFSGAFGVILAVIVGVISNKLLGKMIGMDSIIVFTPWIVLGMFALSVLLTVFAGFIPARIAAKRDPVKCLRSD